MTHKPTDFTAPLETIKLDAKIILNLVIFPYPLQKENDENTPNHTSESHKK